METKRRFEPRFPFCLSSPFFSPQEHLLETACVQVPAGAALDSNYLESPPRQALLQHCVYVYCVRRIRLNHELLSRERSLPGRAKTRHRC